MFLRGLPHEDIKLWLQHTALKCREYNIPSQQWTLVAIHFLEGDLKTVMQGLQDHVDNSGLAGWDWESFGVELAGICDQAKNQRARDTEDLTELEKFMRDHPFLATSAGVTLIGAGCIVVAPTIALGLLNIVGFGALGPVGGSLAATIQSIVYGGATGGVFSVLQSFAMTTAAASSTALTGAVAAITGGTWFIKKSVSGGPPNDSDDRKGSPGVDEKSTGRF